MGDVGDGRSLLEAWLLMRCGLQGLAAGGVAGPAAAAGDGDAVGDASMLTPGLLVVLAALPAAGDAAGFGVAFLLVLRVLLVVVLAVLPGLAEGSFTASPPAKA
jgi:hypothetical protein